MRRGNATQKVGWKAVAGAGAKPLDGLPATHQLRLNNMLDEALLEKVKSLISQRGGNSGAPVFFYLGADRVPGQLMIGPEEIRLAGVMRGTFINGSPIQF